MTDAEETKTQPLADLTESQKEELVVSLATLVCADSSVELSAENINAVITASKNTVRPYWAALFSSHLAKIDGDVDRFLAAPGSGGGGGGGGGGDAAEAEKEEEKEEEESAEEMGGMDMFGGGDEDY